MSGETNHPLEHTVGNVRRYFVAGLLAIIPIAVTWFIIEFLIEALLYVGRPAVQWMAAHVKDTIPGLSAFLLHRVFQNVVALVLVLFIIIAIGWATTIFLGRRLLTLFDSLIARIPVVETIYGAVKMLLHAMQQKPDGVQRIVLIEFPSPEMKTVGMVTRTFRDEDTGRELAAVYVPTTPNPTSGYLEIVPMDRVVSTNWTIDEAMTFIISGGAVAPPAMHYTQNAPPRPRAEKQAVLKQPPDGQAGTSGKTDSDDA